MLFEEVYEKQNKNKIKQKRANKNKSRRTQRCENIKEQALAGRTKTKRHKNIKKKERMK